MTKEERAIKWFEDVPGAGQLSVEERMGICDRVARGTMFVFLLLLVAELAILLFAGGGAVFDWIAGAIDHFAAFHDGSGQYGFQALYGAIFCLPLLVLPIAAGSVYRKSRIRTMVERACSGKTNGSFARAVPAQEDQAGVSQDGMGAAVGTVDAGAEADWLSRWEEVKARFDCRADLESYFKKQKVGEADLDVLDLGTVHFPTGRVVACDPLVVLGEATPYIQTIPAGSYPVKLSVSDSDQGIRYACAKVEVSSKIPVRYELAMTGRERLDQEFDEGDFFGFGVDAGMACIVDEATQTAFHAYWQKRESEDDSIDPFNDLFSDLLEESYKRHPKYQSELGDWLNWRIPGTDCDLPIFSSGFGDGYYPVYFGYDAAGKVSGVYVHLIDVEAEFGKDSATEDTANSSEKTYQTWTMEVDEAEQVNPSMGEIERQLDAIKAGDAEFMILTPSEPIPTKDDGYVCSFAQVCWDDDSAQFHFEVNIAHVGQESSSVIYGKDGVSAGVVQELLHGLLDDGVVPNVRDWEVIVEIGPNKEAAKPARAATSMEKDASSYQRIIELLVDDVASLSRLESCLKDPQEYFRANSDRYEDRGFEGDEADDKIVWIGIADEMIVTGAAIELDWKEERDEFAQQMKALSDRHHLELKIEWLKEEGDIPTWCSILDEKWLQQGFCVASMDIDSDSYILFVCMRETLEKVAALGKEVHHRFDLAKNM